MISPDVKATIKQQEIKELVALSYEFLKEGKVGIPSNLKHNVKRTCIFHLFLDGIPSSFMIDVVG